MVKWTFKSCVIASFVSMSAKCIKTLRGDAWLHMLCDRPVVGGYQVQIPALAPHASLRGWYIPCLRKVVDSSSSSSFYLTIVGQIWSMFRLCRESAVMPDVCKKINVRANALNVYFFLFLFITYHFFQLMYGSCSQHTRHLIPCD